MAEISNPYLEALELNPRFKERFQGMTPEKARVEAMKLSERGLKRLTTEDLLLRARILNHILENSDERTCAAITRGGDESKPYQLKVLESLPDDMLKDWMGLTVRAVQAELNGGLYVLPTDSEVQAGFMELAESLSAKDKSALQRLASAPKQAGTSSKFVSLGPSDAEVCSAGKAVYRSLPKLSSHNQEVVSRTMVDTGD